MRNTRIRLISGLVLAVSVWNIFQLMQLISGFGVDSVMGGFFVAACLLAALSLTVLVGGQDSSSSSRSMLGLCLGLVTLFLTAPALPGLLAYAAHGSNLLTMASALLALYTIVLTFVSVYQFLTQAHETFPGTRRLRVSFTLMLLSGSIQALMLPSDVFGMQITLSISGAFLYGFWGWKAWNWVLLAGCVASLIGKFEEAGHVTICTLMAAIPVLAGSQFGEATPFISTGLMWAVVIFVPLFCAGYLHLVRKDSVTSQ